MLSMDNHNDRAKKNKENLIKENKQIFSFWVTGETANDGIKNRYNLFSKLLFEGDKIKTE